MLGVKLAIACILITVLWFAFCRVLYLGSDSKTKMKIYLHDYPKWWGNMCLVGFFFIIRKCYKFYIFTILVSV